MRRVTADTLKLPASAVDHHGTVVSAYATRTPRDSCMGYTSLAALTSAVAIRGTSAKSSGLFTVGRKVIPPCSRLCNYS
jgi:hypothetical protein